MAKWKYRCNILDIVHDDSLSDRERLRKAADRLDTCPGFQGEDIAQELRDAANETDDRLVEYEGNRVLGALYDFADANLIWTGP